MSELDDMLYRLGKVLLAPKEAFDTHIVERYSSYLPLSIYIGVSFSLSALTVKGLVSLIGRVPPYNIEWLLELLANLAGIIGVAGGLLNLLIYSSLIHISARVMGYEEGRWDDLVAIVAFSSIPIVFPTALIAIGYLASHTTLIASLLLVPLFSLWSLYLIVVGTAVNYGMTLGNAVISSIVGPLLTVIVTLLLTSRLGPLGLVITTAGLALIYIWARG